eukprot:5185265-Pyramimonas_sp.AAC.1
MHDTRSRQVEGRRASATFALGSTASAAAAAGGPPAGGPSSAGRASARRCAARVVDDHAAAAGPRTGERGPAPGRRQVGRARVSTV